MLYRSSFLAVGPVFLLAVAALAGESIFDPKTGHPWDQAREIFYLRRFSTGEVFEHPHAFSPPWHEFQPFVHDVAFYEQVVARLEAVQKQPAAQMEEQPALRRMMLLRDLWPVFDGLRQARVEILGDQEASTKAVACRDDLLRRVARLMRRLELSNKEVESLPNAFINVRDKKDYAKTFNPASPDKPFFPTDLLDKDGPWVAYSRDEAPSPGGKFHIEFVQHRSVFTLHLRTPNGRDEAEKYLSDFRQNGGSEVVPPGSVLALLRRALVPSRDGKIIPSPFVESLQLIAVTKADDVRLKFTLDRRDSLGGGTGLKLLGKDDPIDHSSFESIGGFPHLRSVAPRGSDPPVESLVLGQYKTAREMPRSLETCAACHGNSTRKNIFANFGELHAAYLQPDLAKADATVVKSKVASEEWKSYLRLRMAPGK